ncbi:MAG: hypothetical protein V4579_06535 [Pseudomonadota bacterium]
MTPLPSAQGVEMSDTNDPHSGDKAAKGYELRYFARKHGLTTAQAASIIRRYGTDRAKLNEAAVKLRRSAQTPDG